MTLEEMKARKKELGLSNKEIAKRSGVPLGTVQKIFGGVTEAPRMETVIALEKVLRPELEDYSARTFGTKQHEYAAGPESYSARSFGAKQDEYVTGPENYSVRSGTWKHDYVAEPMAAYQVGPSALHFKRQGDYTLDDYYALPDDRRVELIDGVIYDMAAPSNEHQLISGELSYQLQDFVKKNKGECRVYTAPFDVQLDQNERTMVQPDILVVCDREKISSRGVFGAPDMVVEILSQATAKIDATIKLLKYLEAGVREYWIVDSENRKVFIYRKEEDKVLLEMNTFDELVPVGIWEGKCRIDFPEIAREMDAWAGR